MPKVQAVSEKSAKNLRVYFFDSPCICDKKTNVVFDLYRFGWLLRGYSSIYVDKCSFKTNNFPVNLLSKYLLFLANQLFLNLF